MRRAIEAVPRGTWPRRRRIGAATLDFDHRHRRRIALTTDDGAAFLLDLPEARVLGPGDGLILDTGDVIEVIAADEQVCDVAADSPATLARLAWHLGNRHLPVEIRAAGLRIRDDHVIVAMLEGLGAHVHRLAAPFTPEQGAYAHAGAAPGHGHGHEHGHDDHGHHHDHHHHDHHHHDHHHHVHGHAHHDHGHRHPPPHEAAHDER
jgi:urease accessory protein